MGNGLCVETGSNMTIFDWLDHVLGTAGQAVGIRGTYDDDFIDRLNHKYTVMLLVIFTVIVSTSQYVGDPIECWCPTDFTENRVDYTNFVCWVSNTYYIPMQNQIPAQYDQRREQELTYYQWVPLILLVCSMFYKVPRLIYKVLNSYSGISIDKINGMARDTQYLAPEDREKKLKHISKYMGQWLKSASPHRAGLCPNLRTQIGNVCFFLCGRHFGNYLTTVAMVYKILFLVNSIVMMYLMNSFMGSKYSVYGFEVLNSLYEGEDWTYSPRFPRVTLCDFEIRQMTNLQRWTVQCVLPVNLFNEKIFIFLWFWMVFIAIANGFGCLTNLYGYLLPHHRRSYIRKYLKINDLHKKTDSDRRIRADFVKDFLKQDGIFVLRQISNNANDVIASEVIRYLYRDFLEKYKQSADDNSNIENADSV
ncbi:innexin unc-9-like isoform X2 [Mytilus galloprovincialis]|uniref:Innexin n=2 Tax=Mytilus TaxID=6548 RepID=A0A8B6HLE3_MYTGA|nr:inx [Mytilus edulis]VDI80910.1 Hypothetical predicted protein [Mytilus galloprovincialis]